MLMPLKWDTSDCRRVSAFSAENDAVPFERHKHEEGLGYIACCLALCYSLKPMATNVQIERNPNENNAVVIRKFTKRVQEAGILNRVRGIRYYERAASKYVQKKKALKTIGRRKEMEVQIKLGKVRART